MLIGRARWRYFMWVHAKRACHRGPRACRIVWRSSILSADGSPEGYATQGGWQDCHRAVWMYSQRRARMSALRPCVREHTSSFLARTEETALADTHAVPARLLSLSFSPLCRVSGGVRRPYIFAQW